jgi:hypothetical protein
MMPDIDKKILWNQLPSGVVYGENARWQSDLVDQYKLYVEMADRISQRRTTANSYFLSVNSAILAFVGYLTNKESIEYLWVLAIAGITPSLLWFSIIRSHKNLNTAKWLVVHEIEKRLPISPYDAEWDYVQRGENPQLYRPISHIESWVPWIFAVLHVIVLVRSFPGAEFALWMGWKT